MKLRPLHDRVIVKRLEEERKTAGEIKPDRKTLMGIVGIRDIRRLDKIRRMRLDRLVGMRMRRFLKLGVM